MNLSIDTLDRTDRRILRTIQEDGRISVIHLAERIGLSKSPCLKRLRRLESDGFIRGYYAELDADLIRQSYLAYIQVKLERTNRSALERFNAAVRDIPEIVSCDMMTGGFDYLLKVRTRDARTYRTLLGDVLSSLPGITQTSTFPVMEQVKDSKSFVIHDPAS